MASYGARQADGPASHCALVQRTAARWSRHPTAVFRPALRAGAWAARRRLGRLTRHSGRAETKSEFPGQTNLGVTFLCPSEEAQRRQLKSRFASSAVLDSSLNQFGNAWPCARATFPSLGDQICPDRVNSGALVHKVYERPRLRCGEVDIPRRAGLHERARVIGVAGC
jgi:hypothetical protein